MHFPYRQITQTTIRPIIPVTLGWGSESITYQALVDSGADISLFNAEICDLLGLELTSGKPVTIMGVTGELEACYEHIVALSVGGYERRVPVVFAENVGQDGYGVLGQRGFFEHFKVTFSYSEERIGVNPV